MSAATKALLGISAVAALAVAFWIGTRMGDRDDISLAPGGDARLVALESQLEASRRAEAAAEERVRRLAAEVARLKAGEATEPAEPAVAPPEPDPAAVQAALERIGAGLGAEPGTADHERALADLADALVAAADRNDAPAVKWAEGRLDREARGGRVSGAEAAVLDDRFRRLPAGHGARPGLAIGIVGGWAGDERLGGYLRNLRSAGEPEVHQGLVRILDHHPSEAFGDYAVRMLRETDDAGVLRALLDEDRVEAVCASGRAGEYASALEERIRSGPDLGQRESLVVGLALLALREPDAALARFRRVSADEADPKAASKLRAALELLEGGKASAKGLKSLFR